VDASSPDGEFWIHVVAGLCNRLRVLLSAIGYAEMTGRELVICWPTSRGGRLWSWLTGQSHRRFPAGLSDLWSHPYREVSSAEWSRMVNRPDSECFDPQSDEQADAPPILYLETFSSFFGLLPESPLHYTQRLSMIPELAGLVEQFASEWLDGQPTVGVHIRHHESHPTTREHSPARWFEERMSKILHDRPDTHFYLSTDSSEVSDRLHERFGGALRERSRPPGYNSLEGIQKGVMDLYLLARTDHILGSYFSSFSDMARLLQGERGYEDAKRRIGEPLTTEV
jgi:hypothetical protein